MEIAEDATEDQLAWMKASKKSMAKTEKKIETGEIPQSAINGFTSENWQSKVAQPAAEDIDTDK